ncbi:MAG TPA: helical backbone metal receptor [Gemmatimonadales bacterium]|nr:helical backbone metal receptor [Gemmatimonadales bacterium]
MLRRVFVGLLVLTACHTSAPRHDGTSARRIVSLLPSFTEILFDIGAGDRIVGRTTWCDYPPQALAIPSVGDGMPPNIEAVAARTPDLVVLYNAGPNVTAARQFERIGIRTVLLDLNRLEDLGPATRRLGQLTGSERSADSLATAMDSLTYRPLPPPTASLAFVVWDNPPIIIGRGSYLDELATLAGARNVFHDVTAPSSQVSLETIAARDPDWIAVLSDSAAQPAFAKRREWRAVRAVREARFLLLRGSLFGRPGPRSGQAIRELQALLEHPGR